MDSHHAEIQRRNFRVIAEHDGPQIGYPYEIRNCKVCGQVFEQSSDEDTCPDCEEENAQKAILEECELLGTPVEDKRGRTNL